MHALPWIDYGWYGNWPIYRADIIGESFDDYPRSVSFRTPSHPPFSTVR